MEVPPSGEHSYVVGYFTGMQLVREGMQEIEKGMGKVRRDLNQI